MRLMNLSALKTGEKLSYAIRTQNGNVLLPANTVLTQTFIQRLKSFGINAVYIHDDIFGEVTLKPCLTDETKTAALKAVESAYQTIGTKKPVDAGLIKSSGREIAADVKRASREEPVGLLNMYAVKDNRCLHAVNVATIVAAITLEYEYDIGVVEDYVTAALMHDVFLNDMSEDKGDVHGRKAKDYMKQRMDYSVRSYMSVEMHHERFDGSGPLKTVGEKIPEGARIIAVADIYDSLLNGYGDYKMLDLNYALEQLNSFAGKALDPEALKNFNSSVAIYPVGATVRLNNGLEAVVVAQNQKMPTRPRVRLNMPLKADCIEINLLTNLTIFISKIV